MRPSESTYWDAVATESINTRVENAPKRAQIVKRILETVPPMGKKVLEIGVGKGIVANAVNAAICWHMTYTGTDVSKAFCDFAHEKLELNVVHTDILALPDGPFDQVWAFDSLEHVRHDDRIAGYREIDRVLAKRGLVMLNLPLEESSHISEFDHGITDRDVIDLAEVIHGRVMSWEVYGVPEVKRQYAFVVIGRDQ